MKMKLKMLGLLHWISKLHTQCSMRCQSLSNVFQGIMLVANIVKQFAHFAFCLSLRQVVESREWCYLSEGGEFWLWCICVNEAPFFCYWCLVDKHRSEMKLLLKLCETLHPYQMLCSKVSSTSRKLCISWLLKQTVKPYFAFSTISNSSLCSLLELLLLSVTNYDMT